MKPISAITIVAWASVLFGVAWHGAAHFAIVRERGPFLWPILIPVVLAGSCWWMAPRLRYWGAFLIPLALVLTAFGSFIGLGLLGE